MIKAVSKIVCDAYVVYQFIVKETEIITKDNWRGGREILHLKFKFIIQKAVSLGQILIFFFPIPYSLCEKRQLNPVYLYPTIKAVFYLCIFFLDLPFTSLAVVCDL